MKFELIKKLDGLEMYGYIPCLPIECNDEGERFVGEEADSWLLLEDFVPEIDKLFDNLLDYGDVDYLDAGKCELIKKWLDNRMQEEISPRLRDLYNVLYGYVTRAIDLGTGVVIEL